MLYGIKRKRLKGNHQQYGVRILPELGFDTTNMVKGLHMAGRSVILDLYLREEIEISTICSYYIGETINKGEDYPVCRTCVSSDGNMNIEKIRIWQIE